MTVKQDQQPTGSIPASSIVTLSDESKFLYKKGQKTQHQRGVNTFDFLAAILSGTRDEINGVINQSQNNTPDYTAYDVNSYSGRLSKPVADWEAAHPVKTKS